MSDISVLTPGPQGPPPYRPVVAWAPFDPDAPVTFFKAPYASVVEVDGSLYECLVTHQPGADGGGGAGGGANNDGYAGADGLVIVTY